MENLVYLHTSSVTQKHTHSMSHTDTHDIWYTHTHTHTHTNRQIVWLRVPRVSPTRSNSNRKFHTGSSGQRERKAWVGGHRDCGLIHSRPMADTL